MMSNFSPRAGQIYLVDDSKVAMPPEENRTEHPQRTVLIISGDTVNLDQRWPIVFVCPVSSGECSTIHDVRVGATIGGLKKKGWVRVALAQPFEKKFLGDLLSVDGISRPLLEKVYANLVGYMEPPV